MKCIVSWHCNYHTGTPGSCGRAQLFDTREQAESYIRDCIDEDIARENDRAEDDGRKPKTDAHAYPGERIPIDASCDAYSDIDNEEVFYYISEIRL